MAAKTYCKPIPLPNYPRGRNTKPHHWRGRMHRDFRETAEPTVICMGACHGG